MSETTDETDKSNDEDPAQERSLFFDDLEAKFDTFQALRKSDKGAADAVLDELGASDELDREILLQVSAKRPLGHPERFEQAHALAVRSLEVLDRNGTRKIKVKAAGPLDPHCQLLRPASDRIHCPKLRGQRNREHAQAV